MWIIVCTAIAFAAGVYFWWQKECVKAQLLQDEFESNLPPNLLTLRRAQKKSAEALLSNDLLIEVLKEIEEATNSGHRYLELWGRRYCGGNCNGVVRGLRKLGYKVTTYDLVRSIDVYW